MKRHLTSALVFLLLVAPALWGARSFNGSSDYMVSGASVDLTGTSTISVAFWLYENAFNNFDELAAESSANYNNSVGAFLIDPNSGTFAGTFEMSVHMSGGAEACTFSRPSAAAWHQFLLVLNSQNHSNYKAYVDGTAQTLSSCQGNSGTGNFGNFSLYLMSRAGSSLFNAGRLAEFAVWTVDESANASALAGGALASSVDSGNLVRYVPICGSAAPEPDQVTGNWTVHGTTQVSQPPGVSDCGAGGTPASPTQMMMGCCAGFVTLDPRKLFRQKS